MLAVTSAGWKTADALLVMFSPVDDNLLSGYRGDGEEQFGM